LIDQYNFAGFHDLCIYPEFEATLAEVHDPELLTTKGLKYMFGGYVFQNGTATNLFELLVTSEDDSRFGQWLTCFAILFGDTATNILS